MNKISFLLLIAVFLSAESKNVHGSRIQNNFEELNSALYLEEPFIRMPLCDYLETVKSPKLILGEGHILNAESLAIEFRREGDQELTESMIDFLDSYSFHKNEGYYTASAELGENFNSDWCGNLTNSFHRESLFLPNTFDLVFDATYHPGAISEQLFNDISKSLRSGGVFIMPLPIHEEESLFMCGHNGFSHEMDWYSRKLKFKSLDEAYEYWKEFIISQGFSCVSFHKSPITLFLEKLSGDGLITNEEPEKLNEKDIEVIQELFKQEIPEISKISSAAQIDSHLAHYGLGTHYLITEK